MNIQPLTAGWATLSPLAKLAVAGGLIIIVVLISGGVGGLVTRYKDAKFDKAEAARAVERTKLEQERDAHLRRAEEAEAQVKIVEAQAAALTQLATEKGKTAAEKQIAADKIAAQVDASVAAVGALPPDEAQADIIERLRRLGYLK